MKNNVAKVVGKNLQQFLVASDISQKELAKRTGIPYATIATIIHGKHSMSIDTYKLICDTLELGYSILLPSDKEEIRKG